MFVSVDGDRNTATVFSPIGEADASLVSPKPRDGNSPLLAANAVWLSRDAGREDRDSQVNPPTNATDNAPDNAI